VGEPNPVTDRPPPPQGPLARAAFLVGGSGLLIATAVDSLAVLGRHTGFAFLGSIEIVQSAVVLAASGAVVMTTLAGGHAAVHLLIDRLTPSAATRLARVAALLGALVFLGMAVGSFWLMAEGWNGHERTELLRIPFRWLRLIWTVAALLMAVLFLIQPWRKPHA
jgi:TRAP-type C4-dicarboxylate transport system permease small subunit